MPNTKKPSAGDIITKRKLDTVQLIREPKVVLATITAEEALRLSEALANEVSIILKATSK